MDIECPLGQVSVLCRGGSIIPLHQGGMTAAEVRNSTFNLVIAMPEMVSQYFVFSLQLCKPCTEMGSPELSLPSTISDLALLLTK